MRTDFFPWIFCYQNRWNLKKTKPTQYTDFKTDTTKVVLVFSISFFFTNNISQGRTQLAEKITSLPYLLLVCGNFDSKTLLSLSFNLQNICCYVVSYLHEILSRLLVWVNFGHVRFLKDLPILCDELLKQNSRLKL